MGFFGLKTSAHSGTQFKHKRAFKHKSKFLNNQDTIENVKIVSAEDKNHNIGFPALRLILALVFITIIFILISTFIHRVNILMAEKKEANTIQNNWYLDDIKISDEKFKVNLFEKAKYEYKNGNYLNAHEKLYAILLSDENNIEAEKMLIKVLEAKCSQFDIGCNQLSKYSKYLEMKYEKMDGKESTVINFQDN